VHPIHGRVYLGNSVFDSREIAAKELDKFVGFHAAQALAKLGLKAENAVSIRKAHGDKAEKVERDYRARNNPDLH